MRRRAGACACAIAELELGEDGFELLAGDLLFEAGDFRLGIQLAQRAGEAGDLDLVLLLRLLGFNFGAQGVGRGLFCLGMETCVDDRDPNGETGAEIVGRKGFQRIEVTLNVV